jgi:hypothetical protein
MQKKFLRSWLGVYNYVHKFMLPKDQQCLRRLHKLCAENADLSQLKATLAQLANPPLISLDIGSYKFEDILGTLIVTDANRDSYSGAIFRLTKGCHNSNTELLTEDIKNIFPEVTSLQLLGITGSNFGEKLSARSSTFRERFAMLSVVSDFKHILCGPVVCATDNANCTKHWQDTENLPVTELLLFHSHVHKTIWLQRTSLIMKLIDGLARDQVPLETPATIRSIRHNDDPYMDLVDSIKFAQQSDSWAIQNADEVRADGLLLLKKKIIVPDSITKELQGRREVVIQFKMRFEARNVHSLAAEVCMNCLCYTAKAVRTSLPIIGHLSTDTVPFGSVSIDTVGPIRPTSHGFQYILSVQCNSTRYIVLREMVDIGTDHMIRTLKSIFYQVSFPYHMRLDNFASFRSRKFEQFTKSMGIEALFTPIHSPHRNGMVERQHRVINEVLRYYFQKHIFEWVEHIPMIQARINNRTITVDQEDSSRVTPFTLVHRYQFHYPGMILEPTPSKTYDELMDLINSIQLTELPQGRQMKFKIGDIVLRYAPKVDLDNTGKLNSKFRKGTILEILGRRTFLVRDLDSSSTIVCDGRNLRRGGV